MTLKTCLAAALALLVVVRVSSAPPAMPVVVVSDEFRGLLQELRPELERAAGVSASDFTAGLRTGDADTLHRRLLQGEAFDLALLSSWTMDPLIQGGVADPRTHATIARSAVGLAVPTGRSKPDISSVDRFRQAMLDARSVLVTMSTAPGSTRLPLERAFQQLGLTDAMQPKMVYAPVGQSAQWLADGKAEYAVNFVSNIVLTKGIDLVGPLPEALQRYTGFDAIMANGSTHRETAARLIDVLRQAGSARLARLGLLPPG